jgi:hypothetical protein
MNPKLYELMQAAGYAAPNLAPRASKLVYLVLDHLLSTTDPNSRTADEIRFLMSENKDLPYTPS